MKKFSISAPGSVMLMGEHAVLHGEPALVTAIDRRVMLSLKTRDDDQVSIHSGLGEYQKPLAEIDVVAPFKFVLNAILLYRDQLPSGFEISVESAFSEKVGLGSSAAITAAVLGLLQLWLFGTINYDKIYHDGLSVIRIVQGLGSGADLAASVYGGLLYYHPFAGVIRHLNARPPIFLVYAGYKTKTADVVRQVAMRFGNREEALQTLYHEIGSCVRKSLPCIESENWLLLGGFFEEHQSLQIALGVNDEAMQEIIETVSSFKDVFGAKISGSGLGDCVIGLGEPDETHPIFKKYHLINVVVESEGVK